MGLRLIIGRAGTGKTQLCVDDLHAAMADEPLGPPLLWIVPQQATFGAERRLLTQDAGEARDEHAGRGTFRAQVLSFPRLARLIGRELGLPVESSLDTLARIILLEEIIRQNRDQLQLFGTVAQRPGFVSQLDATLRELRQHGHSGQSLRTLAATETVTSDAVLPAKLHDLALLLDAWNAEIGRAAPGTARDSESVLDEVARRAGESTLVRESRIWIDGTSALSALELRLLVALSLHARQVTFTLLADPDSDAIASLRAPADMGVFARTERLHRRIIDACRTHRVPLEPPVPLRPQHRLGAPDLKRVEAMFLARPAGAKHDTPIAESSPPAVELWECSDPETEVRIAAQWIRAAVMPTRATTTNPGSAAPALRYRDIGLVVPALEEYQDAIRRIFQEHAIPHFIDQRRSIAHHPLVELVRSAVSVVASGWERDEVLLYMKTGLAGLTDQETALLENYILAHGITRTPWNTRWEWLAQNQRDEEAAREELAADSPQRAALLQINQAREKVWQGLRHWTECCAQAGTAAAAAPAPGATFVTGLQALLQHLAVEPQIQTLIDQADRDHHPELAQIHEQAWRQLQDVLALLARLLASKPRTLEEFAHLLATALEGLTLGLIPPTVDEVIVSNVERSRLPEVHTALLLGAVEGALPRLVQEDPILSDTQRQALNDLTQESIGAGSDRQLLEMPFFDYVALTRAGQRLIVSYPLADRQGRALRRSQYIKRLQDLLGEERLRPQRFDATSRWNLDRLATVDDLLSGVLTWVRSAVQSRRAELLAPSPTTAGEGGGPPLDPHMTAAYHWLIAATARQIADPRIAVWDALRDRPAPALSATSAAALYPPARELRLSVSQLENFAECPLKYFLHYTLALRPREELELDTLNLGILYHRIMERIYLRILRRQIPWPDCPAAELHATVEAEVEAACEELHAELAQQTPGYDKMQRRARRILGQVVEADRRRAAAGSLRPRGVEVVFGRAAQQDGARLVSLPMLRLDTPAGRAVAFNGKIDRLDVSPESGPHGPHAVVIDYKSSASKTLKWSQVYAGLMLQLPAYALVVQELAHLAPAGAFYEGLKIKRPAPKSRTDTPTTGDPQFYQQLKPRGMLDADAIDTLDQAVDPAAPDKSLWYAYARTKKDQSLGASSDALEHDDFARLLAFVRTKLATLADTLMAGQIAPHPFQDGTTVACDYCDFVAACPFDPTRGTYHTLEKLKKREFLARLQHDEEIARGESS